MELIFATNNPHKLQEAQAIIGPEHVIKSLRELGFTEDIPETADSLEGNAEIKARTVYDKFGLPCFADDTGLEVQAINNEPGVHSARYAGIKQDSSANLQKLLKAMQGIEEREARFRTSVCLIIENKSWFFEGRVTGKIAEKPEGSKGFGYDPVFIPDGYTESFAQLPTETKNQISHRARAIGKLADFIRFLHQIK